MGNAKGWKRELVESVAIIAIALMIVMGSNIGLQFYLGTPTWWFAVESGSMEPTLYRGDLVIVRGVDPETLQVGDIIIFDVSDLPRFDDTPWVHRIIEIEWVDGFIQFRTKGDNNPVPDWFTRSAENVIAKVIGSVRYLGFVSLFLHQPGGIYAIILLFVVFFIITLLCDTFSQRKEGEKPERSPIKEEPADPDSF